MSDSCGILGLPNVGKSSLFKLLSGNNDVDAANYPFCTIEPNVGIAVVPDERLKALYSLFKPRKAPIYQHVRFVDIAGLVEGASKGAGLGNKFLSHVREVDALLHVVRFFGSEDVIHVSGKVDPVYDSQVIEAELVFSDFEQISGILSKSKKNLDAKKITLLKSILDRLNDGIPIRKQQISQLELEQIKEYGLLSSKPMMYVLNFDDKDIGDPAGIRRQAEQFLNAINEPGAIYVPISIGIELEIAAAEEDMKSELMEAFGIEEDGRSVLIRSAYDILGYISFFTVGDDEVRAWTIKNGDNAVTAAGKIHTDFIKGFVRAEVISYVDMMKCKSIAEARKEGLLRCEGKDYIVKDGDILNILSNV